jgi:glutamine---fructose-6-phosphate transaminase (isomerizing)
MSQSRRTPGNRWVLREYARSGATSIAVTNDPQGPLSEAADVPVVLGAEPEEAVPATKIFLAEVVVMTLIGEALGSVPWDGGEWTAVPECIKGILQDPGPADEVAATHREADGVISVGRSALSHRPRRRAQAQGDLSAAGRRIVRGRPQTWSDRRG